MQGRMTAIIDFVRALSAEGALPRRQTVLLRMFHGLVPWFYFEDMFSDSSEGGMFTDMTVAGVEGGELGYSRRHMLVAGPPDGQGRLRVLKPEFNPYVNVETDLPPECWLRLALLLLKDLILICSSSDSATSLEATFGHRNPVTFVQNVIAPKVQQLIGLQWSPDQGESYEYLYSEGFREWIGESGDGWYTTTAPVVVYQTG